MCTVCLSILFTLATNGIMPEQAEYVLLKHRCVLVTAKFPCHNQTDSPQYVPFDTPNQGSIESAGTMWLTANQLLDSSHWM